MTDSRFEEMLHALGAGYSTPLLAALTTAPSVSVRANAVKGYIPDKEADLVPWCEGGFYLSSRPLFAADPAWHQGLYYVQDASSMVYARIVGDVVARYFADRPALRYLDACAAPGGKTTAALGALPASALVVANELDRHRANILLENLGRAGAPNVVVSRGDAAAFGRVGEAFDIIAVDAPCSGEGMMRKDADAVAQWSPGLIEECARMQHDILDALWQALRPGGVLIYSTCTFNRTENELTLGRLIERSGAESIDLGLERYAGVFKGFDTPCHCYRFAPGHIRGEGLFVAAVRKPDADASRSDTILHPRKERRPDRSKPAAIPAELKAWLAEPEAFAFVAEADGEVVARPKAHADFIAALGGKVSLVRSGLPVAVMKGRDYAPAWELAVSTALAPAAFARLDLDYAAAIDYLRGESLTDLPSELPRGYVLACYGGEPLGFAKNIGRRANNLYPDRLRLRLDPRAVAEADPIGLPLVRRL